jgi:hypothetical protein
MSTTRKATTQLTTEIRKVQSLQGNRGVYVVIPHRFARVLHIEKGDYLRVHLEGERVVLEQVKAR